ncbi:RES family NAD+ phosphorylase [Oleispirillum naphthae]|uniref:RES family NAD+ phosphorylase n=1 Tax=Oleispirillum naphthae TaxID=2838853 RepID=UPI0030822D5D
MWTLDALRSEAHILTGRLWRIVEGQWWVSTMRLADSLLEQRILEEEIETAKPRLPPGTEHLHPLLRTPFRYEPYDKGSRFRRAHQKDGVFYGSEEVETAIAEMAFLRALVIAESPEMVLPQDPSHITAFKVPYQAETIDLTHPPFSSKAALWTRPNDYQPCQDLADAARAAGVQAIRYQSVRDPKGRANLALLSWHAFSANEPDHCHQTWHLFLRPSEVIARREFPPLTLAFSHDDLGKDPRLDVFFSSENP